MSLKIGRQGDYLLTIFNSRDRKYIGVIDSKSKEEVENKEFVGPNQEQRFHYYLDLFKKKYKITNIVNYSEKNDLTQYNIYL